HGAGENARLDDAQRHLAALRGGPRDEGASAAPTARPALPAPPARAPDRPAEVSPAARAPARNGSAETLRLPVARLDALLDQLGELVVPRLELEEGLGTLERVRQRVDAWQREWRKVRPAVRQLEREGLVPGTGVLARFLERNEQGLAALAAELGTLQVRLAGPSGQVRALTEELQEEVKRLRMLPLSTLTETLERLARDFSRSL